jgi:hypothetical protein
LASSIRTKMNASVLDDALGAAHSLCGGDPGTGPVRLSLDLACSALGDPQFNPGVATGMEADEKQGD